MQAVWGVNRNWIRILCVVLILTLYIGVMPAGAVTGPGGEASVLPAPVIDVPDVKGRAGENVDVPVMLDSKGRAAALQFDLTFDEQLLAYQGTNAGDIPGGYSVVAHQQGPGRVRVVLYNPGGGSIPEGSRTVAVLSFQVSGAAQPGQSSPLGLSGVIVSDASGSGIQPVDLSGGLFAVTQLTLAVNSVEGQAGYDVHVPVILTGGGQAAGIQFELAFDRNLLVYQGVAPGNLPAGYTVDGNQLGNGRVRIIIYSNGGGTIPAGTQTVAVLTFHVPVGAQPGSTCPLELGGVLVSDSGGGAVQPVELVNGLFRVVDSIDLSVDPESVTLRVGEKRILTVSVIPPDAEVTYSSDSGTVATVDGANRTITAVGPGTATITVSASKPGYIMSEKQVSVTVVCLKGDVNGDGGVDVLDIVRAIDIALGKVVPTPAELCAADINDDQVVDVLDAVNIINLALSA